MIYWTYSGIYEEIHKVELHIIVDFTMHLYYKVSSMFTMILACFWYASFQSNHVLPWCPGVSVADFLTHFILHCTDFYYIFHYIFDI